MLTRRNLIIAIAAVAVAAAGVYFGFFFKRLSPEQQILRELEFARASFEAGRIKQFLSVLADDYKDQYGFDKSTVVDLARQSYLGAPDKKVTLSPPAVKLVDETTANVQTTITVTVLSKDGSPSGTATAPVTMVWRKGEGGWKIISTNGYAALTSAWGADLLDSLF